MGSAAGPDPPANPGHGECAPTPRSECCADSTSVWLKQGEVFSVEELIYAMMIQSANDAAYAVARTVGGSVPAFVAHDERQGARPRHVPHHLSQPQRLSPAEPPDRRRRPDDPAGLCPPLPLPRPPYQHPQVHVGKIAGVRGRRALPAGRDEQPQQPPRKDPGVDGLKTGFTNGAGFCLAATAQRDGRRIIVVMMDSPDSRDRDLRVAQLLDRGFSTTRIDPFDRSRSPPARAEAAPATAVPDESPVIKFAIPSSGS